MTVMRTLFKFVQGFKAIQFHDNTILKYIHLHVLSNLMCI